MRNAITAALLSIPLIVAGGAANAASWIPDQPSSPQPIGWGSDCVLADHDDHVHIWSWLTFTLTGSECVERAVVER